MTAAASAFVATLDEGQREATVLPLHVDERATWSNLPIIMVQPDGLLVGDMNDDQRAALHNLLRASMSSQGYAKISAIMRLDDVFEGPGRRASLAGFEGLQADELSVAQMRLLRALVAEFVGNVDFDSAEAQLELINEAGWDALWFSWRSPVDLHGEFYFRVHGPTLIDRIQPAKPESRSFRHA